MGGYVQMDKDLEDDPRVSTLTDHILDHWVSLGVPTVLKDAIRPQARDAVLGALYRLWRHADTHLKRHDRLESASHHLAEVTGLPVTVLKKFPSTWLVEHDDGLIELPNYSGKNALQNKDDRREKNRLRTAAWRRRKQQGRDASQSVTSDTSQHHGSVTTGPGPGPVPDPLPKGKNPLPPQSGGHAVNGAQNGKENRRSEGSNPRAAGTNPRAIASREQEAARWLPLLDRAERCGFRGPYEVDSPESYETSLRLHERSVTASPVTRHRGGKGSEPA